MARYNFYQKKKEDKIVYGDGIVEDIILLAVSELSNVELFTNKTSNKKARSIKVNVAKNGLEIEIFVKIHYSLSVSDIAFKIQETIRHNIESMTDYHIKSVNVNVVGVFFDEKKSTKVVIPEENNENVTKNNVNKDSNTKNEKPDNEK